MKYDKSEDVITSSLFISIINSSTNTYGKNDLNFSNITPVSISIVKLF